ncbi:hypothetical protein ACX3VG_14845, partial [Escherichia coli]
MNVAGIHVLQGVEDVKLALYVLAFLDRSNIGFAKQTYQIDTGLSNDCLLYTSPSPRDST